MDNKFSAYYFKYLNHNEKESVVSSDQRKKPLNEHYYYHIIGTYIDDKPFISVHPKYFDMIDYSNDLDLEIYLRNFQKSHESLTFRCFYRMTTICINDLEGNIAKVFDQNDFNEIIMTRNRKLTDVQIKKQSRYIESKNKFIVKDGSKIVAIARITDIDFNGGNIAVYTDPNYRKLGYGKMVVVKCVQWCLANDIVPIYLVDVRNMASLNLAKSIGFSCQSEEFVLSIEL